MKRIACLALCVALPLFYLWAEDNEMPPEKNAVFVLDGGFTWVSAPELTGGHIDFGVVLFERVLYIQNHFLLRGGGLEAGGEHYSVLTLSDKIIFGRRKDTSIYTYIEGGIGVYGHGSKKLFEAPLAYSFGFGGGFETASRHSGGIYGEVGYLGQKIHEDYPAGGFILQTGVRFYF